MLICLNDLFACLGLTQTCKLLTNFSKNSFYLLPEPLRLGEFLTNYCNINKELIRIGKLANIDKHFSFHTARHTNATLLIYKGANITTVQKLLGHKNLTTTQIYGEVMGSTIVRDLKKCQKGKD